MTMKQYLGLLGFAFVVVWIAAGFGHAVLCLIAAGVFYGLGGVMEGEIDLGQLQERLRGNRSADSGASYRPPSRAR